MINIKRYSLILLLLWGLGILSWTAMAGGSSSAVAMSDGLVAEIDNLNVIQMINEGQWSVDQVAVIESESQEALEAQHNVKSHRSPRRAVLSQR